jgi:DNA-binding MarR family transcriptional regulator
MREIPKTRLTHAEEDVLFEISGILSDEEVEPDEISPVSLSMLSDSGAMERGKLKAVLNSLVKKGFLHRVKVTEERYDITTAGEKASDVIDEKRRREFEGRVKHKSRKHR